MKTIIITGPCPEAIAHYCLSLPMDAMYPELHHSMRAPYHPRQVIERCSELVGLTFATLSEHIILWFQKQIRDCELNPDDVELWYVEIDTMDTSAVRVMFDAEGDLTEWPESGGFFIERLGLVR